MNTSNLAFDGATYSADLDQSRLSSLLQRVYKYLSDGEWHTLAQIAYHCNGSEASVSARVRDCRKIRNGNHTVERRRTEKPGLFEYRIVNPGLFI